MWGWTTWRLGCLHTKLNVLLSPIYRTQFDKILLTVLNISFILIIEHLFGIVIMEGVKNVNENELELIALIRENDKPELMASYMLNLFLDYLRTHGPSQEKHAADPLGSV